MRVAVLVVVVSGAIGAGLYATTNAAASGSGGIDRLILISTIKAHLPDEEKKEDPPAVKVKTSLAPGKGARTAIAAVLLKGRWYLIAGARVNAPHTNERVTTEITLPLSSYGVLRLRNVTTARIRVRMWPINNRNDVAERIQLVRVQH